MSFNTEVNCLLIIFIILVNGMPRKIDTLPILQFTNKESNVGEFRWAAEAVPGGLLGMDGGLYANAETPWSTYAGAGLGDQLGEDNLGAGLYAGAELSSAGPEAAAGLDGDSVNPIADSIYAGATSSGGLGPALLGSNVDQAGFDGIISDSADNEANLNSPVAAATTATSTADATASGSKISTIRKRQVLCMKDGGTVAADKTAASSVFDDTFNVPITTLSAFNKLVNKAVGITVAKIP